MRRLIRTAAAVAFIGLTCAPALAQQRPTASSVQAARFATGRIQGTVSDDHGGPLPGAMVSALGATIAMAVTDKHGRFVIDELPAGDYFVRAHHSGYAASPRELVRVGGIVPATHEVRLRSLSTAAATDLTKRPVLTAGLELPDGAAPEAAGDDEPHPHGETAWRLRHIKRSILKSTGDAVAIADAIEAAAPPESSVFSRALDGAATAATALFTDLPFSGEVNLLTTSALGQGPLFSADLLPRGVAYVSIGAPLAGGEWTVRASMSQSDLSSWILAGAYASRTPGSHDYAFGVSYTTQEYQGGNPAALAAVADGARNVGELYGSDRWIVSPHVALEYAARYARYDYLRPRGLLSPRLGVTVTPAVGTRVTASVAQRMLAPGAEEFLPPSIVGPWLPPERTFAPLGGEDLRVERGRFLDVDVEHDFDQWVVGVRRFYQSVDDQLITLFGLPVPGSPDSPGHYYVASAGALDASGWGLRVSTAPSRRVRGTVGYTLTHAEWISRGDMAAVAVWAPQAIRPATEDIHDVMTSVETEIPETATRVFVLYKVNTAFARGEHEAASPGLDTRFDVQVNQSLPFMPFSSTQWEVLVGVRNLFRDPMDAGSIYDELLVVRPPTRVVGGVLVRF
ncbi:MAG TPA: TonB-dependent receptor [Vicinamibacterales bacterium]|nr:TonB-dependent receptor [Vicinamibacterales bacterium]